MPSLSGIGADQHIERTIARQVEEEDIDEVDENGDFQAALPKLNDDFESLQRMLELPAIFAIAHLNFS